MFDKSKAKFDCCDRAAVILQDLVSHGSYGCGHFRVGGIQWRVEGGGWRGAKDLRCKVPQYLPLVR